MIPLTPPKHTRSRSAVHKSDWEFSSVQACSINETRGSQWESPRSHSSPLPALAHTRRGRQSGRDIIEMNHLLQCMSGVWRTLDVCGQSDVCRGAADVRHLDLHKRPPSVWMDAPLLQCQYSNFSTSMQPNYTATSHDFHFCYSLKSALLYFFCLRVARHRCHICLWSIMLLSLA